MIKTSREATRVGDACAAASEAFDALGSDTGGSIRQPAALCGIVGLMPTFGRVSTRGVIPLSPTLDHVGPMTRTVRDAALMRMAHAGAVMINWFAVACELQRDWRNDAEGLANLLANHLPAYKNLITSYQAVANR